MPDNPRTVTVAVASGDVAATTFEISCGNPKVAFEARPDGGDWDIYTMNPDGTAEANVTNHPADDRLPAWSPDRTMIAFVSDRAGESDIWVLGAGGESPENLTSDLSGNLLVPDFSPDGTRIAFTLLRGGAGDLWVMNAHGSGKTPVSDASTDDRHARWSPDGTKFAFRPDSRESARARPVSSVNRSARWPLAYWAHVFDERRLRVAFPWVTSSTLPWLGRARIILGTRDCFRMHDGGRRERDVGNGGHGTLFAPGSGCRTGRRTQTDPRSHRDGVERGRRPWRAANHDTETGPLGLDDKGGSTVQANRHQRAGRPGRERTGVWRPASPWAEADLPGQPDDGHPNEDSGAARSQSAWLRERLRRGVNVTVAAFALPILLPVMLLIAAAIRLSSPGPVLYRQERVGLDRRRQSTDHDADGRRAEDKGGRIFTMYKFRTMYWRAREERQLWARPDDPRVTPVGRFLRKTRLDELPQLFNVLKGDMNIVGPRPEQPQIFRELRKEVSDYQQRQKVLPGITGWAQVHRHYDRSLDDVKKKVDFDLEYIARRSAAEDLRIMAMTVPVVLRRQGGL